MATATASGSETARRRPWYKILYVQVLIAVALGVLLGYFYPDLGKAMKPLGEGFIKLVKMLIAPIIFLTVVHGIASMSDMKKVGRVGLKALIYFEVLTTVALIVGLVIVNVLKPGVGMNVDPSKLDAGSIEKYQKAAQGQSVSDFFLHIIPDQVVGAFAQGEIIQVLFFAVLFAFALHMLGERGKPVMNLVDVTMEIFFRIVAIVMRAAPIGAFGAMAFTIGSQGLGALASLGYLMAAFYLTCLIFIFGVLGLVAWLTGFSIFKFVRYIKEELLIVLGTSSSESVLPRMLDKMKRAGAEDSVVGLVIPAGYSFNLDGTCIYLTMAAIFLAQATNTDQTLWQQIVILAILLLTSKGAAGVTGSGFIVLAATLQSVEHIPVTAIALILGIDRFMSEARALTNLIGNGVATIVVAKWEGALDEERLHAELNSGGSTDPDEIGATAKA
ncbi:dicarboxylate/amino acid:cation symporter [Chelatococcus sambhunathii]|uniref:C4-dicarboxylate transport protein n=1 Tax=Chelatococcus sambhunathii TaxID=363953 RepID=A0ABU1DH43_9HYPH|nr:dicarboxylate/amino acid:cation symporter [Chelatococcus sambhunathii]MDR4307404.1 dicarboxylate/amino acid:cation symporter [Chelatococcus sambhunathii]